MRYGGGYGGHAGEYGACDGDSGGVFGGGSALWGFEDVECEEYAGLVDEVIAWAGEVLGRNRGLGRVQRCKFLMMWT